MMKNAWRTLAAIGLVTSVSVVGCVVSSGDDENTGGSGGSTSGGGSGGSGATGATGATGGGATGGTGATGGATGGTGGGAAYACDLQDGGTPSSTAGSCKADDPNDPCQVCVEGKCCAEWEVCLGTNPGNACGWGGATPPEGEIFCIQKCVPEEVAKGSAPADAEATCAGKCATAQCTTVSVATSDLVACLDTNCFTECFSK